MKVISFGIDSQSEKGRRYNSYMKQVRGLLISGFQAHNNNTNRNKIEQLNIISA